MLYYRFITYIICVTMMTSVIEGCQSSSSECFELFSNEYVVSLLKEKKEIVNFLTTLSLYRP